MHLYQYMSLPDLLLTKEEIPISKKAFFYLPIHPRLLDEHVRIGEHLAHEVFPQAAQEWYSDLQDYAEKLEDQETKKWITSVFLHKELEIKEEYNRQAVDPPGYWECHVITSPNGFARVLEMDQINRVSLYLNSEHMIINIFSKDTDTIIPQTGMTSEKLREFTVNPQEEPFPVPVYHHGNIEDYPNALFLRNWGMLYINEAMKQVL